MKLSGICSFGVVSLIIFAVILTGCRSGAKEGMKQQGQIKNPAASAEKPAPAVVKPETAAPASEKPTPIPTEAQNVPMLLKFAAGDTTKYKVVMEGGRKVKWEGSVPAKPSFQSGENISRVEMIFTQKIQSVSGPGNAEAVITINGLKYVSKVKESTVLDFDSSRAEDANNPMAKLIGQNYTIEITPSGQVSRIVDTNSAMAAVKGNSPAQKTAMKLLEPDVIRDRHGTLCLPVEKGQISSGGSWKNVKTFSFGLMGPVSYERVYTLNKVEKEGNHNVAIVEMKAVPTAEAEPDKNQLPSRISKGFDNKGQYEGELKFDPSSGKVEKFSETLELEWLAARPSEEKGPEVEPTALTMSASRFYSIEKIE